MDDMVYGFSLPDAYHKALLSLWHDGDIVDCPDWNTKCKELSMTIVVRHPLSEPMISRFFPGGPKELQQYTMEIVSGILDFEVERGKWAYTYHQRMGDQVQFVIDELRRNPSSRRAAIVIRQASDSEMEDPPCLQHIQYTIRKGKLNCYVLFRSNDAVKATFMNAFALIQLQKRIAQALEVEVGTYTHRANSFHAYYKDFGQLRSFVERMENDYDSLLCYRCEGDWSEEMDASIPEIMAAVERLRGEYGKEV